MASIAKRPDGTWRARYRDEQGKEHAKQCARKVDAQRWLDEVTAGVLTGQYVDPRAGRVTFADYCATWQKVQMHRPSTTKNVNTSLWIHAVPAFGARPIATIRPSDVQSFVHALSTSGLAPGTVGLTYKHVRSVFRAAQFDRVIAVSPCQRIALPRVDRGQVVPLPTATVHALADALPARLGALVTVMAGLGLRPGEAAGLAVDRIDFLRRRVRVDQQLRPTHPPTLGPLKTEASYRTVPLPDVVGEVLARHVQLYGTGPGGLIFTRDDGQWWNRTAIGVEFRRARAAAGAPADVTQHDCRHYFASLLIARNGSVPVVQARLGHATAKETMDTYAHLWPDSEDQTRDAVDAVLGRFGDSHARAS